ncbi:serine O-acetyltransferase [Uliginosibacterium sp. H3]|uniref:Serine acetyltransferase n=1 Tax=Uliginosibacterium silvisoli TaxID=3114758 RepID=A0ABU6KBM7_9RHOO|nr:serine O-acetyltransferase [Uliginosibacterium sp. H3]
MFAHLREDINSVLSRDPAARSRLEVLTCYPGIHALFVHRISHALWRRGFFWLGRSVSVFSRWWTGIEIHPGAKIGRRVFIDHGTGVVIGETAEVGDDCTIYQGVTLGGTSLYRGVKRHPTLEHGVVVGAGAKVLGGFTVGEGAKIGSNAVVTKPVPAGATAVGIPARVIETKDRDHSADVQGFSAYGITRDMDDPLSKALHALLDHASEQDKRIDALVERLKAAGLCNESDVADSKQFDHDYLSRIVD